MEGFKGDKMGVGTGKYDFRQIEEKILKKWEAEKAYSLKSKKAGPRFYMLEMFPYPSGEPHMGHARNYTIGDVIARVMARKGNSVLHPIGFDSFGLPAENAALKDNIHPRENTAANISKMKKALKRMGMTYDFEDEIITSEPDYYKWTQWLFLIFYKMGLAEKKEAPVNWCDSCQTVLANEQVIDGKCERCSSPVKKRVLSQWFFKITDYAQRLLDDMEIIKDGWPERVLTIQKNWIGRSVGALVDFKLEGKEEIRVPVFTTRPDTLFGVTFFILSPEHKLVDRIVIDERYKKEISRIRKIVGEQSDIERGSAETEKIGCFTGRYAINPLNGEKVPIWIANYVLLEYGTGAIMAVPAHDERDFEFARKYDIDIKEVISPDGNIHPSLDTAYTGEGIMVNSGRFDGMDSKAGTKEIISHLEEQGIGKSEVNFKLRDWLISRQRYWGAPIPVVYCGSCGTVPIPEKDLPVLLPYDIDFRPKGLSPLELSEEFVNTPCPKCGGPAKRETDTMDTFVCSSWYFLRYCSPHNDSRAFDESEIDNWMPVDLYIGGIEHATMHLIYSRFFIKVLYDKGLVKFKEPFTKYFPHGVVNLDGQKMSKSKGNIVNPSEIYNKFGADTLRLYILFIGPADSPVDWSDSGAEGASRFLGRLWRLVNSSIEMTGKKHPGNSNGQIDAGKLSGIEKDVYRKLHQTIKKVTGDILDKFNFNTAISALMELVNLMARYLEEAVSGGKQNNALIEEAIKKLLILLSPIAPFITEKLWLNMGNKGSIHKVSWPSHDPKAAAEEMATIIFQVNGKLRDRVELPVNTPKEEIEKLAEASEKVKRFTENKKIIKKIIVPNKLINIVVRD